jgi:hypothetical protein
VLLDNERQALVSALWEWAEGAPPIPVAGFLGGAGLLTPRELAEAAQRGDRDGLAVLDVLEHGVRREGLAAVTDRLRSSLTAATIFRSINEALGAHLYLPGESSLHLGDVVRAEHGSLTVVSNISALIPGAGEEIEGGSTRPRDVVLQHDADFALRRGDDRPEGLGGKFSSWVDIGFASPRGWVLVLARYVEHSMSPDVVLQPLTRLAADGVWQPDWLLVRSVGTAEFAMVLTAQGADARITLGLRQAPEESVSLAGVLVSGGALVAAADNASYQISDRAGGVSCSLVRLSERSWSLSATEPFERESAPPRWEEAEVPLEAQTEMLAGS